MIKINIEPEELHNIIELYTKHIIKNVKKLSYNSIYSYWEKKMCPSIINSSFDEYNTYIYEFEKKYSKSNKYRKFRVHMKNEYERLIKKPIIINNESMPLGYWLAKKLNVNVCPYCNRQYIFTIVKQNGGKCIRPQFDHFYDKATYPYLSLSFYNLIPSCSICNHIKGTDSIKINPYIKGFDDDCKFKIDNISNCITDGENGDWSIVFSNKNEDFENHNKTFALEKLYSEHKDYVNEIVIKALAYENRYFEDIKKTFELKGLNENCNMDQLIFGNYIETAQHSQRPLSKLTKDILDQIKKENY